MELGAPIEGGESLEHMLCEKYNFSEKKIFKIEKYFFVRKKSLNELSLYYEILLFSGKNPDEKIFFDFEKNTFSEKFYFSQSICSRLAPPSIGAPNSKNSKSYIRKTKKL